MKNLLAMKLFLVIVAAALMLGGNNVVYGQYVPPPETPPVAPPPGQPPVTPIPPAPPSVPGVNIEINKLVGTVVTSKGSGTVEFVDNIAAGDARFLAGDTVFFKLIVKNTSDRKLTNVLVEDFLPGSINLLDGSTSFNGGDFDPGEVKEFVLTARVKPQDQLPADRGVFCELNRARASGNGAVDEDTAQFCIEKQVAGVPGAPAVVPPGEVPQAGPEMGLLLLGGQMALIGAGVYLKKRS